MSDIRWNLESVYPAIDSKEYIAHKDELVSLSQKILDILKEAAHPSADYLDILKRSVEGLNRLFDLSENLQSFVYAFWSTNTEDEAAQKEVNDLEDRSLVLQDALVRFRSLLPSTAFQWDHIIKDPKLHLYRFWLEEQKFLAGKQMSPPEEALAADLQRSGGDAWDRLHGKLASTISRPWDDASLTVTQLRALAFDPNREVRRRAWQEETAAFASSETAFAAALNGVKGTTVSLNTRRGWGSALEKSLMQNRLSRKALDALLGVMTESLPLFRRYFQRKAARLSLEKLSWYDLFAPVGISTKMWSWEQTADFIPMMFDTLSKEKGNFARRAFHEGWIDGRTRKGKVGGAYCTSFPLVNGGESRILCNFDGSFDSVSTVAHELGHAWHAQVMNDVPALNRVYPMTLAETASLFAETLVFQAALGEAPEASRPAILDTYLIGASQVIVDILSRFHFEMSLMRRRSSGELSPRELSQLMMDAQSRTYGDALNLDEGHPWMWAVKGHYYSVDLAFYNFPYAFGQLFALGLYSLFREEGPSFANRYTELLRRTGSDDAVGAAQSLGFDIEKPEFWNWGISVLEEFIKAYENAP